MGDPNEFPRGNDDAAFADRVAVARLRRERAEAVVAPRARARAPAAAAAAGAAAAAAAAAPPPPPLFHEPIANMRRDFIERAGIDRRETTHHLLRGDVERAERFAAQRAQLARLSRGIEGNYRWLAEHDADPARRAGFTATANMNHFYAAQDEHAVRIVESAQRRVALLFARARQQKQQKAAARAARPAAAAATAPSAAVAAERGAAGLAAFEAWEARFRRDQAAADEAEALVPAVHAARDRVGAHPWVVGLFVPPPPPPLQQDMEDDTEEEARRPGEAFDAWRRRVRRRPNPAGSGLVFGRRRRFKLTAAAAAARPRVR